MASAPGPSSQVRLTPEAAAQLLKTRAGELKSALATGQKWKTRAVAAEAAAKQAKTDLTKALAAQSTLTQSVSDLTKERDQLQQQVTALLAQINGQLGDLDTSALADLQDGLETEETGS